MSEETRGQQNRKHIRQEIESVLSKYCPNRFNKMANLIAYDFNLSPDTLKYRYLPMFLDAGVLQFNEDSMLVLSAKGKLLQKTEDGLTEKELAEELAEENEQRNKLGKSPVSLKEWKKMRYKRFKPCGDMP
jgi:hypothetical protein